MSELHDTEKYAGEKTAADGLDSNQVILKGLDENSPEGTVHRYASPPAPAVSQGPQHR